jgi:hypothetical protein
MQADWAVDPTGAAELVGQAVHAPTPVEAFTDQNVSTGHTHAVDSATEVPAGQAEHAPETPFL